MEVLKNVVMTFKIRTIGNELKTMQSLIKGKYLIFILLCHFFHTHYENYIQYCQRHS